MNTINQIVTSVMGLAVIVYGAMIACLVCYILVAGILLIISGGNICLIK